MNASTTAATAPTRGYNNRAFWERLWKLSGVNFVVFFIVAYAVYGHQPQLGAPADALTGFYTGDRSRILIAAVISGLALLNLLWFVAALRTILADAGLDGWGAAATAASTTVGAMFLLFIAVGGGLAYSIAGSGNQALTSGLNDFAWATVVASSFPRAMLIMAGTFGFWRAGYISNAYFGVGVAGLVLVLLGGTTWLPGGFWSPDGTYSRFVSPIICLAWVVAASGIVFRRSPPATRAGW